MGWVQEGRLLALFSYYFGAGRWPWRAWAADTAETHCLEQAIREMKQRGPQKFWVGKFLGCTTTPHHTCPSWQCVLTRRAELSLPACDARSPTWAMLGLHCRCLGRILW